MRCMITFEQLNIESGLYQEIVNADTKKLSESLSVGLVNYDMYSDMLGYIPHRRLFDLAMVPLWRGSDGFRNELVILSDSILAEWEISSEDELLDMACGFAPDSSGVVFMELKQFCEMMMPDNPCEGDGITYMLTNRYLDYGASALCYDGIMKYISKSLGHGFYVIPANVHHMFIIPDYVSRIDVELHSRCVNDVNSLTLSSGEYLSNKIYYYDKDTEELVMA